MNPIVHNSSESPRRHLRLRPIPILPLYEYLLNKFNYPSLSLRNWFYSTTAELYYIWLMESMESRKPMESMESMDVHSQSVFNDPVDLHRSHLSDARTWTHNDADVTLLWAGDHRRSAVSSDDSGQAGEAPGIRKHGTYVPTETIESAKMSTVAQMKKTTKGRPPKEANLKGQTNIRRL